MKVAINSENAPKPVGPYSQAIAVNGMLFCSGQIAIDPSSNQLYSGEIEGETKLVLKNVDAILKEAGSDKSKVIKCSVFVSDIKMFERINVVYSEYFDGVVPPARELVEVRNLPKGVNIEISVIASL